MNAKTPFLILAFLLALPAASALVQTIGAAGPISLETEQMEAAPTRAAALAYHAHALGGTYSLIAAIASQTGCTASLSNAGPATGDLSGLATITPGTGQQCTVNLLITSGSGATLYGSYVLAGNSDPAWAHWLPILLIFVLAIMAIKWANPWLVSMAILGISVELIPSFGVAETAWIILSIISLVLPFYGMIFARLYGKMMGREPDQ